MRLQDAQAALAGLEDRGHAGSVTGQQCRACLRPASMRPPPEAVLLPQARMRLGGHGAVYLPHYLVFQLLLPSRQPVAAFHIEKACDSVTRVRCAWGSYSLSMADESNSK
jgi:hypothetical protein